MMRAITLAAMALAGSGDEGRAIYQYGEADGPVLTALPGETRFASTGPMPCAACHGADGAGSSERVATPGLVRVAATAADARLFQAALQGGYGADGRRLRLMPRYAFSAQQREALAAYLSMLAAGSPPEPGVTAEGVTIDVSALSRPVRLALLAYAASHPVEAYGRKVTFADAPGVAFAAFATAAADKPGDVPPSILLSAPTAAAGRAAVLITAELLRRTGRRLTRAGFAAAIDALRHQEIDS